MKSPKEKREGQRDKYATQDMKFAAFLKEQGCRQVGVRDEGPGRKDYKIYEFDLSKEEARSLWIIFQDKTAGPHSHPRALLEEYEALRAQRYRM